MAQSIKIVNIESVSQKTAAAVLGVTQEALCRWKDAPRNLDRTYSLPALVAWRCKQVETRVAAKHARVRETSPSLERMRSARAGLSELELSRQTAEVISVERARQAWSSAENIMRQFADMLQRTYGPDAKVAYDDALDDALSAIQRTFDTTDTDKTTLQNAMHVTPKNPSADSTILI